MSRSRQHNGKRSDYLIKHEKCELCGRESTLELHHIIPLACGGRDVKENWLAICRVCHSTLSPTGELTRAGIRRTYAKNIEADLDDFYRNLDQLEGHFDWEDALDEFDRVAEKVRLDLHKALGMGA